MQNFESDVLNMLTDPKLVAIARSHGMFAYLEPFTLKIGVVPTEAMFLHGYVVSRPAYYEYVANAFAANDEDIFEPIPLFDGTHLKGKELYALLSDPEFQEATNFRFHIYAPITQFAKERGLLLKVPTLQMQTSSSAKARNKHHSSSGGGHKKNSYLQEKIAKNMHEWKAGTLKGGAGNHPMVHSQKQALAIAYAQSRKHSHKK